MALNDRVAILRQAIVAITQSLTNSDVEVTQSGLDAYVKSDKTGKPILVNLPYLPDNADDQLIDAIQGFLDHEVAHILFTDFEAQKTMLTTKRIKNIANILEDARVEKEMGKKYRGSNSNLTNTGNFFLENIIDPNFQEAVDNGASQEEMVGKLVSPLLRALSGQYQFQEYMKDKISHIQDFYDKIEDLAPEFEKLSSTKDVIRMAQTIVDRLEEEPPSDEENDDDGENKEGNGEGGAGGGGSSSSAGASAGGDDGKDDGEPSKGEGSTEGEDEKDGKDDKKSKDGKGDDKKEKGKSKDGKMSHEQSTDDVSNLDCGAILDEIDKESANNFDEALSRKMGEQVAAAAKGSPYVTWSNKDDKIEPLKVGKEYDSKMLVKLSDKVDAMVGPMTKDLERAMVARSKAIWENGLRKGRLNGSALARLRVGDDRVFRQKHENTTNDVAVSLVVDASGSMSGSKIHTAAASAYALSQVLDRLKITHEVICFTTGEVRDYDKIGEQESKHGVRFSRKESLYMPIVKGFGERIVTETKKRFAWLPNSRFLRNNVDGESIEIAYRRLMQRKEKGKIMIVLSDGCPAASGESRALSRHLKDTIKGIEKSGTKIIGIGIESSEVKNFYSKNIVVNNISELPQGVIRELRTMLLAN